VLPDTPADEEIGMLSLLQGFEATVPSTDAACAHRHATRNVSSPWLALEHLSWHTRSYGGGGTEQEGYGCCGTSDCRFLWIRIGQLEDKWN